MKYWFKNAIIYSLNIKAFKDDSGDGIGDLDGLKERLEYIAGLGVNTVWMLPIFSTPNQDNGYDVSNYYDIDSRIGDMAAFVEFLDMAEDHNLRVLIDMPLNHTSNQHFWFQQACKNPDSHYRDYYIWSKEKPEDSQDKIMFEGQQSSNWAYDEHSDSYYYHSFYKFQPDLNYTNPSVRREIRNIMHFWLRLGVSGFRIDALPHIVRNKGNIKFDNPHLILRELRQNVDEIKNDAVLMGESDVEPERYKDFFGDGREMHMLLNFYLTNYLFLALAQRSKKPIQYALEQLPDTSLFEQYANFLRNHDELDLERLNEDELKTVFEKFAPEDDMQIFGRGIRRRMAPMLKEGRLIRFAKSLHFSMPGTPILRYGDEIGMGDDLDEPGRSSVQTVMQWSTDKNAGFSSAEPDQLCKPVIDKGEYNYQKVNVANQRRDPESLLNWTEKLIGIRTKCTEFGRGNYKFWHTGNEKVMAHSSTKDNEISIVFHNFSEEAEQITINLDDENIREIHEVFYDRLYEEFDRKKGKIQLDPLGYRWFKGKLQRREHTDKIR